MFESALDVEARLMESREEFEAKLHADCGEYLKNCHISIKAGWLPLVDRVVRLVAHKAKRWQEVVEIQACLQEEHGPVLPKSYVWIERYFETYPEDPYKDFEFVQIKEKFGGLRMYTSTHPSDFVDGVIKAAEARSYQTCEWCGGLGQRASSGSWMHTACPTHAEHLNLKWSS